VQTTNVISTSYSSNEADLTAKYEQRQCLEYMKLGLQGVSILYSSGDFRRRRQLRTMHQPRHRCLQQRLHRLFNPSFPGTCPYITSVGATQVLNGSTVRSPRICLRARHLLRWRLLQRLPHALLPKIRMATYFANHAPLRRRPLQQLPDRPRLPRCLANGVNYVVAVDGQFSLAFGTSASCPTFASLVT
jgi:tripeptidyl-peptidase-1